MIVLYGNKKEITKEDAINPFNFFLGIPNTLDMALTGKTLNAKKAKKVGLVDRVVDPLGKETFHSLFK